MQNISSCISYEIRAWTNLLSIYEEIQIGCNILREGVKTLFIYLLSALQDVYLT